ncbi:hypothetical protein [Rufibacter radiotolerans]|uniref:hypothetical protein n=1 Tax=Rufibacter radiotolerans TaxID=1379910 RepID=UPI000A54DD22|nr:hypothetical protein [Rufibacter radiotolerans]
MTEEEFDANYADALENILVAMAENSEIAPEKFYNMACLIENLRFFSPVLYCAILKGKK